jgi:hypothetical protein
VRFLTRSSKLPRGTFRRQRNDRDNDVVGVAV